MTSKVCPERPGVIINTIKCNLISGPGLGYHKRIIRDRNPARASPRCRLLWLLEEHHGDDQRQPIGNRFIHPASDLTARVEALMITSTSGSATRYRAYARDCELFNGIVSTTVSNDQR
uniref:Uncharacterized protein n=1 Tax=Anopheles melas TaxID=34690 RepID=A0A182TNN2_9DIPT